MGVVKEIKRGDACPACGGALRAALVPTDEQFRQAFDRENPQPLPPTADSASPAQRAELGELHRCVDCGYQTRFKDDGADAADEPGTKKKAGARRAE